MEIIRQNKGMDVCPDAINLVTLFNFHPPRNTRLLCSVCGLRNESIIGRLALQTVIDN